MNERAVIPKAPTFIEGLDDILGGGVPEGRTTLVSGAAGSGKTILGLEFLYRGALAGEPGILLCFEEKAEVIRANARTLGWDFGALEAENKLCLLEGHVEPETTVTGEFSIDGLLAMVKAATTSMGARRVVVDAVDVLLGHLDNRARERRELMALHAYMIELGLTTLLTAKVADDSAPRYEFLDFMVDCVIRLEDRSLSRRLRITKYRGSGHARVDHPYVITGGIRLLPPLSTDFDHQPLVGRVSLGNSRLDALLDGGLRRGGSALIGGASGTGKTTLTATIARAACERGEKILYIGFEESASAIVHNMRSPGIDLQPAIEAGLLRFLTTIPEALTAEEHLHQAFETIDAFGPDHVVVDGISSCRRMVSSTLCEEYVTRMLVRCAEQGRSLILVRQTRGSSLDETVGLDAASMLDTIIVLAYSDTTTELNRKLLIAKARAIRHSNQHREFSITDRGIEMADVYVGGGEMPTGTARREREIQQQLERQRRQQAIRAQAHEVSKKKAMLDAQISTMKAELADTEGRLELLIMEDQRREEEREIRASLRGEDPDSRRLLSRPPGGAEPDSEE